MPIGVFYFNDLVSRYFDSDRSELPEMCHFQLYSRATGDKPIYEIITNRNGCGLWSYDAAKGTYKREAGDAQYMIPQTDRSLRRRLKTECLAKFRSLDAAGTLTDVERELLAVLEKDCSREPKRSKV